MQILSYLLLFSVIKLYQNDRKLTAMPLKSLTAVDYFMSCKAHVMFDLITLFYLLTCCVRGYVAHSGKF